MLQVHLLGQLRVLMNGEPWPFQSRPKALPLWAYLLLHRGHPLDRDQIAFALWPDTGEGEARANLRRHLHHLQSALPAGPQPWLIATARTIQWNPSAACWLDVAEFERLCRNETSLEAAIALYSGDLLERLDEEWLLPERERVRVLYQASLLRHARACHAARAYATATASAQRMVRHDPLDEDAQRLLMTLHYESGDRAGALAAYEHFARHLRVELGVEPMPETLALFEAIVANAPLPGLQPEPHKARGRAAPSAPPALPLVGRAASLAQLYAAWDRAAGGSGGLLLLSGEAGVGKSRLVAELARRAAHEGGCVLAGGTTTAEPQPYQALVAALRAALPLVAALDLPPIWLATLAALLPALRERLPALPPLAPLDPERDRARLFEALARCLEQCARLRPTLLILEDLHWAGSTMAELLAFLARRCPTSRLLLLGTYRDEETSRAHPLRTLRRTLAAEGLVQTAALSRLTRADVRALLAQVAALAVHGEPFADWLYDESEGSPLFFTEMIRYQLERLPALPQATEHVVGGVRATIAARLDRLSPPARALAETAAVVGPAFTVELVREVGGWEEGATLDALHELLDRQIVRDAGGREADYAFTHHLIQVTAATVAPPEVSRRRHRRAAAVLIELYPQRLDELAGVIAQHFGHGGAAEPAAAWYVRAARRALAVYADDGALSAIERGLALGPPAATRFDLLALHETILERQGDRAGQRAALDVLDALAPTLGNDAICEVLRRRIALEQTLGNRAAAAALIAALGQRAADADTGDWRATAHYAAANHAMLLGQYDAALAAQAAALEQYRALGDRAGQAQCLCLQAEIAIICGPLARVAPLVAQARALAATQTNQSLLVRVLGAAGLAAFGQQQLDESQALWQQCLDLCCAIGDREGEANAHQRLAVIAARRARFAAARAHYGQAAALYTALDKRQGLAAVRVNTGILESRLGHLNRAAAAFAQAGELFAALNDLRGEAVCAANLAAAHVLAGDYAAARPAALRGLELARALGSAPLEATALVTLGDAERALGDLEAAVQHMEAGVALRRAIGGAPDDLAGELGDLALLYVRAGRHDAARDTIAALLDIHAAGAALTYPQRNLWAAARVARALGDHGHAHALLAQAHAAFEAHLAAQPDAESRAAFLQLRFNRELLVACERDVWPTDGVALDTLG